MLARTTEPVARNSAMSLIQPLGAPRVPLVDPEYQLTCLKEYEAIRARRNRFKGKPDEYDRIEITLDRIFEGYYKFVLTNLT